MKPVVIILVILALGCLETNTPIDIAEFVSLKAGNIAPDFSFKSTSGETISLSKNLEDDRSTIIITMSPGCISCNISLTHYSALHDEYEDKVSVIGFNVGGEEFGDLKDYVESKAFKGNYVNVDQKTITEYGIVSTDIMYIIDTFGRVTDVTETPRSKESWTNILESI